MPTLDIPLFRLLFPEFADAAVYPDVLLQARWDNQASSYIDGSGAGYLAGSQLSNALQLMLAHLCRLGAMLSAPAGGSPRVAGVVTAASVDKVSVTLQPPPARGEWGYWLAQTPYGQQLSALLASASAGGFYVGGLPERSAFRKTGGVW